MHKWNLALIIGLLTPLLCCPLRCTTTILAAILFLTTPLFNIFFEGWFLIPSGILVIYYFLRLEQLISITSWLLIILIKIFFEVCCCFRGASMPKTILLDTWRGHSLQEGASRTNTRNGYLALTLTHYTDLLLSSTPKLPSSIFLGITSSRNSRLIRSVRLLILVLVGSRWPMGK